MREERQKRKRKKKRSLVGRFFTILFSILFVYFGALGGYIAYTYLNSNEEDDYFLNNSGFIPTSFLPSFSPPERTTFLLAGVDDDETRTDTIMLACLNSVTNDISLISIPRDTLIKLTPEGYSEIQEHSSGKLSKELKVNAIHSKAGKDFGMEALRNELERQLDIDIDYYAKVNCEAFRYIVDSIGGIEFNVEKRLYYSDPTQNLYIDLKPGLQHLDGDKAEQLVRCRYSYARQDLDRVEVQQKFLKEFFKKALSTDTIMSNPGVYLNTIMNYVTTDMGITDMVKYAKYAKNISGENIKGYTLPGEPETINGISYYIMDKNETEKMMYDIFKSKSNKSDNENKKEESSKGKSIQVLNGGYTTGLAGSTKTKLEEEGFTVENIGDYNGVKKEETRIYTNEEGMGYDLIKYFKSADVIVDSLETGEYDIVIVLGTGE